MTSVYDSLPGSSTFGACPPAFGWAVVLCAQRSPEAAAPVAVATETTRRMSRPLGRS